MKNDLYKATPNASGANIASSFGRAGTPKDVPYVRVEIKRASVEDLVALSNLHTNHIAEEARFDPLLIGKMLVDSIPLVAKDSGSLVTRVYESNEPAKQFWRSNGFSSQQVILRRTEANASGANTSVGFGRAGTPKDVKYMRE